MFAFGAENAFGIDQWHVLLMLRPSSVGWPRRLLHIPSDSLNGVTDSLICEVVTSPTQLPAVLDIALRTAVNQKNVAVLVTPGDVLLREMDRQAVLGAIPATMPQNREIRQPHA